jgi:hypothetical protein
VPGDPHCSISEAPGGGKFQPGAWKPHVAFLHLVRTLMVAGPPIRAARGHGAMLYPTAVVRSIRGAIPDPHTVDEMPMTMVTMTIVTIVIVARGSSSMVPLGEGPSPR